MPARRKSLAPPPPDEEAVLKEKLRRRRSEGTASDVLEQRRLLKQKAMKANKRRDASSNSDESDNNSEDDEAKGDAIDASNDSGKSNQLNAPLASDELADHSSENDDDASSSSEDDSSEDDLDGDEESAISAAVAAGLATMFGQPSPAATSTVMAQERKARANTGQHTPAFAASDPSPYLAKSHDGSTTVRTNALKARHNHKKGSSVDVAALADSSDIYGRSSRPYSSAASQSSAQSAVTSGKAWFDLPATAMTEEMKLDLRAVRMRGALDPKRFYKALDRPGKFVQLGTVVEGRDEFYTSRLARKERRTNLVEELLADTKTRAYTKRKYNAIQDKTNNKQKFGAAKRGRKIGFNKKKQSQSSKS